jgi:hypothetical protein
LSAGNRIALGKSSDDQRAFTPRNQSHHRVVWHECRRLGIEPGASEPRLASPINHASPTGKRREQRNIEVPPRAKSPSSPRGNET